MLVVTHLSILDILQRKSIKMGRKRKFSMMYEPMVMDTETNETMPFRQVVLGAGNYRFVAESIEIRIDKKNDLFCCICQTSAIKRRWTLLRCKHYFHESCLFKWFERRNTCPYCGT
ncbi:hypothetical protein NPIL_115221 [Nephila pilipes]|uniref:RING-type domain-containing protein n=1 Tax=Nephila pilipes TaxID=299642 RepID=A0A8X6P9Z2_NEPPI|nr:hypothetical protein NPIL_115221 [Nephila pilipes]